MGSQHPPGSVSPVPYLPQQADWRGDERGNPSPSPLRSAQSGENLSLPRKSHLSLGAAKQPLPAPPNPKHSHMGTPYGDTRDSDVSPQFTPCVALRGKNPFVFPCLLVLHSFPAGFERRFTSLLCPWVFPFFHPYFPTLFEIFWNCHGYFKRKHPLTFPAKERPLEKGNGPKNNGSSISFQQNWVGVLEPPLVPP